tara:strand:+ start:804 stop:1028 length:225 start_codon:yes stop_codon:yes gene_type:complete
VHEAVPDVTWCACELLGRDAGKPFSVDKNLKRLKGCDEDVDSQIEFVAVEEERVWDVTLDNSWLLGMEGRGGGN